MKIDRRQALTMIGAAAIARGAPAAAQANPAAALRALLDRSARADAALDPLSGDEPPATGTPAFVDPLGDVYARTLEANKRAELAAFAAIDRAALGPVDRIAYDVFAYRTRQMIAGFDDGLFDVLRQANFDPSFGLHVEFPDLVAGTALPFATAADYQRGLARLDGFADYLDSAVAQSRRGRAAGNIQPRVLIDNVLGQVDAMLALPIEDTAFYAAVKRMPAGVAAGDRARFEAAYRATIASRVLPGYRRWRSYLRDEYRPVALAAPGRWAMKDGARLYAAELARHTTTSIGADAIHALGLGEVGRIRGDMERVRRQVGFSGNLASFFAHVRTDPRYYFTRPEDLLDRFAQIEQRIWAGSARGSVTQEGYGDRCSGNGRKEDGGAPH